MTMLHSVRSRELLEPRATYDAAPGPPVLVIPALARMAREAAEAVKPVHSLAVRTTTPREPYALD